MTELIEYGFVGLFVVTFLGATVLPFGTEPLFSLMVATEYDLWRCIIIATIGNTLGGMTSFYIGTLGNWHWIEKYLGVTEQKAEKLQQRIVQYGSGIALLCWLPAVGDVIAVVLGLFKARAMPVAFFMFVGKGLRYVVLGYLIYYGFG